jgi:phosphate transport system protein
VPAELDIQMEELNEKLLTMASYAETAVNHAVRSLIRRDDELARQTGEEDDQIDRMEIAIDETALQLLACRPKASDVRFIATAMKISRNLERVGDEATTISRRVMELSSEPQLRQATEIPPIAGMVIDSLKGSLNAFVNRDSVKARTLILRDREVDGLNRRIQQDLAAFMVERPSAISRCLNLMVISKSLERIGDHAKNMAEEVVYLCEGRDIRHTRADAAAEDFAAQST